MERLGAIIRGEIDRQTGIRISYVDIFAKLYSERMKGDIFQGKSSCLSMDELYASKNIGFYWF
jgi:hypothetical protein